MTELAYLGGILLLRIVQRTASKENSRQMPSSPRGVSAYMAMMHGMSAAFALILLLISGNIISSVTTLPPLGWLIACATGAALTASTVCSLLALRGSSIVLGALFGMAGLLIPTIFGIFIYNQPVSWIQWCGIAALFAAAVLLASSSKTTNGRLTAKTVILLICSMLANGSIMLLQTLYKNFLPNASVTVYSFLQFFIPSTVMLGVFLVMSIPRKAEIGEGSEKSDNSVKFTKRLIIFAALAAGSIFGISQISTIASAVIPVAVLFPISDGGGAVIAAIIAATVYKEKITWKSALGIALGIAAVCVMKLG